MRVLGTSWKARILLGALAVVLFAGGAFTAVGQSLDIVFVLDASGSIDDGELKLEIDGITYAIRDALLPNIPPATINVGVVCFGTEANVMLPMTALTPSTWPQVEQAIADIADCDRGQTNMADGLTKAVDLLKGSTASRQVINLVSNGLWNEGGDPRKVADPFKATAGHEIWTLGVGIDSDGAKFMKALAGPAPATYFAAADFKDFERAEKEKLGKVVPSDPTASLEDLLRTQIALLKSFLTLSISAWPNLSPDLQATFLAGFEDCLKNLADSLLRFEDILHMKWPQLTPGEQAAFLASFEDLIKGQGDLLKGFEELLKGTLAPPTLRFVD